MSSATLTITIKAASLVVMASGAIVALSAHPATGGIASFLLDLLFWPLDNAPQLDTSAARLLAGIGGGVMVGWGLMLWLVAVHLLPRDPGCAARIIRPSVIAWFLVDSAGSLAAGVPLNALLNLGFAVAFLIPLSGVARSAS